MCVLEVSGVLQRSRMGMFGLTPGSVGSALTVLYIPNRWLATFTGRFHIFTPTGMAFSWFWPGCIIYVCRADETQPAWAARGSSRDWVSPAFGSPLCLCLKILPWNRSWLKEEDSEMELIFLTDKKWKEKDVKRQIGWVSKPPFPPLASLSFSLFLAISTEV